MFVTFENNFIYYEMTKLNGQMYKNYVLLSKKELFRINSSLLNLPQVKRFTSRNSSPISGSCVIHNRDREITASDGRISGTLTRNKLIYNIISQTLLTQPHKTHFGFSTTILFVQVVTVRFNQISYRFTQHKNKITFNSMEPVLIYMFL